MSDRVGYHDEHLTQAAIEHLAAHRRLIEEAETLARLVIALQPEDSAAGDAARRTLAVIEEWRLSE